MHALHADLQPSERRSRYDPRDDFQQPSSSYDESFLRRDETVPVLVKSNSSDMMDQPQYYQQQQRHPYQQQHQSSSTIQRFHTGMNIGGSAGASEALLVQQPQKHEQQPIDSTEDRGSTYRDREMRAHQSIVYNRSRGHHQQYQNQSPKSGTGSSPSYQSRSGKAAGSPQSFSSYSPHQSPASTVGELNQRSAQPQQQINPTMANGMLRYSSSQPHQHTSRFVDDASSIPFDQRTTEHPHGSRYNMHGQQPQPRQGHNRSLTNDGQSVMSGYSKPFDEKTEFSASLPIIRSVTPERSTNSNASSPAVHSGAESSTTSAFWKHATPPPVISHQTYADRFKLPPPRVVEPASYSYQRPQARQTISPERQQQQANHYQGQRQYHQQSARNDHDLGRSTTSRHATRMQHPAPEENYSAFNDESLLVHEPSTPQHSPSGNRAGAALRQVTRTPPVNAPMDDAGDHGPVFEEEKKEDVRQMSPEKLLPTIGEKAPDIILNRDGSGEDDSIFDYLRDESKKKQQQLAKESSEDNKDSQRSGRSSKKKNRHRNSRQYPDDVDDSSIETPAGSHSKLSASPSGLSLRAKEAWKRNRQQDKASRAVNVKEAEEDPSPSRSKVSFGAVDTVHHYPNQSPDLNTVMSGGSEYTKSMESEVEDLFKDIFLIGDGKDNKPGRKKLKNHYDIAQDESTLDSFTDENTRGSYTDDETKTNTSAPPSVPEEKKTKQNNKRLESEEDPLLTGVWNIMESGVGAIGGAFGFLAAEDDDSATMASDLGDQSQGTFDPPSTGVTSLPPAKQATRNRSLLGYVSESLLGASDVPQSSSMPDVSKEEQDIMQKRSGSLATAPAVLRSAPSLDQDLRLIQLATESARMFHKMHGYQFDESREVDIVNEIKFVVADLKLPMGMVFQENPTGCWITKIMPEGSAAKTSVQVGDQLAAIDGISAIHMKVDQVAEAVRTKKGGFELTLLRYVGKLHPSQPEEGYEVNRKPVVTKTKSAKVTSAKANTTKQRSRRTDVGAKKEERSRRMGSTAKFGKKSENLAQERAPTTNRSGKKSDKQERKPAASSGILGGPKKADKQQDKPVEPEKKRRFGLFGRKKKS